MAAEPLPRIGLALGSGGGRGWAHIGVLRALSRAGVRPDVICGTSIGALVGGVYLAGHLDSLDAWARGLTGLRMLRYMDLRVSGGGLLGGDRLTKLLDDHIGETRVEDLSRAFAAVATELPTGHEIWLTEGSLVDAVRASFALPGIFTPVAWHDRWLVDGALVNPVPVSVCRALRCRLVIAVNLNADMVGKERLIAEGGPGQALRQAQDEAKSKRRALPKPVASLTRRIFGAPQDEGPSVFDVMVSSLNVIQDRVGRSRLAGDPPDVTIAPRLGHMGLLEFDRADEAIAEGEAATARALSFLKEAVAVLR